MALMIIISTGDLQMCWNVLSLSFREKESAKWPLRLSDISHNYVISDDCIQQFGKTSIWNT